MTGVSIMLFNTFIVLPLLLLPWISIGIGLSEMEKCPPIPTEFICEQWKDECDNTNPCTGGKICCPGICKNECTAPWWCESSDPLFNGSIVICQGKTDCPEGYACKMDQYSIEGLCCPKK